MVFFPCLPKRLTPNGTMLRAAATALLIATAADALNPDLEVPLYCRLLSVALQEAENQPFLGDLNVSATVHVPVVGDINVSVSHLEIDRVKVFDCDASLDAQGRFNVGVKTLGVDLKKLAWQYTQLSWPHVDDHGVGTADTTLSFNITIDMVNEKHHVVDVEINALKVHLGAVRHSWITGAVEKVTNFMTPVVREVVYLAAEKAMDKMLAVIYDDGACVFAKDALKNLDVASLQFISYEPFQVHVPLLGDVNISVNSTGISPPTSMKCNKLNFTGTQLAADIQEIPFSVSFVWSYLKPDSSFWHNQGTGEAAVVAGTKLFVDIMKPSSTSIAVSMPVLGVKLHAESDAWMYDALTKVLTPMIREGLQLFGGKELAHYLAKCIADPTCPHVTPNPSVVGAPAKPVTAIFV